MTGATPPAKELNTWKEISAYLGVGIRTAQEYENELGLPIHRLEGRGKPRVRAFSSELDEWKVRHGVTAEATVSFQEMEALPTSDLPEDSKQPAGSARARFRSVLRPAIYFGLAVLAISIFCAYWAFRHPNPVSDFRVQGRNLIAFDSKARELWRHAFPLDLRDTPYASEERTRHFWIGNLDSKGPAQLVFNAVSYREIDVGTPVFCFGATGKSIWEFVPGRSVVDGSGDTMVPPYPSNTLLVLRGKTAQETRVVISSNHYLGQANQVAFLSSDGQVVGEYWHPGHLLHLKQVDLDGNGHEKLLLGGVNNGNHQATLVVLDPLKVSGIVTPKIMQDHRFELLNMAAANEAAVVFFPRSCISAGQSYTRVSGLYINKDRIVAAVSEGIAEPNEGFVYEFDYGLHVVNVVPTNGAMVEKIHRDLQAQGKLDHAFNVETECARLKAGVIVRRGG